MVGGLGVGGFYGVVAGWSAESWVAWEPCAGSRGNGRRTASRLEAQIRSCRDERTWGSILRGATLLRFWAGGTGQEGKEERTSGLLRITRDQMPNGIARKMQGPQQGMTEMIEAVMAS